MILFETSVTLYFSKLSYESEFWKNLQSEIIKTFI